MLLHAGLLPENHTGVYQMWYRRLFSVPPQWQEGSDSRVLLHFGAVDWESEVFINGQRMGLHRGG